MDKTELDALPSVRARVNYAVRTDQRPYAHVVAPPPGVPARRETIQATEVTIRDVRPVASELALDTNGFELRRRTTAATNLFDEEQIRDIYYPEVEQLLIDVTGAAKVVIYGRTLRSVLRAKGGAPGVRDAVRHVHNDYSARTGLQLIHDHLDPAEAAERLKHRFVQINVWRPLIDPVQDAPLALCDASSVAPDDLIVADLIYPSHVSETYSVAGNPDHRWFYFPRMRPDEALLFKCFDSDETSPARFTPHTAFDDPTAPPGAVPRESIEVRGLAFF
jgi:hypothetical protein